MIKQTIGWLNNFVKIKLPFLNGAPILANQTWKP